MKKKYLINIFTEQMSEADFDRYSSFFDDEFEMIHYQFKIEEFFPEIIESVLISLFNLKEIEENTIVIQSNVADLVHYSSKIYSELIDAIIITGTKIQFLNPFFEETHGIVKIISPKSVVIDSRLKSVYINSFEMIDSEYLMYLSKFNLFSIVAPMTEFAISNTRKVRRNINYLISENTVGSNFDFISRYYLSLEEFEEGSTMSLDSVQTYFGLYLLYCLIMHAPFEKRQKVQAANIIYKMARKQGTESILLDFINLELEKSKLNIGDFIDINFLAMKVGDKKTLPRVFNYLDANKGVLNTGQLYLLLTNSFAYQTTFSQQAFPDLAKKRAWLMDYMREVIKDKLSIKGIEKRERNIAIVVGQLLGPKHSPTKWAFNYVNALKKHEPKLNIKIFVEDFLNYSTDEIVSNNVLGSMKSSKCMPVHKEHLPEDVEIYYSDSSLNREHRVQADIDAITEFKPSVIYKFGNRFSLSVDQLFEHYPIISHTLNGWEESNRVDVFTGGYTNNFMRKEYMKQNILHQTYISHTVGIMEAKSEIILNRSDYQLSNSDFVLITVGNRLATEISLEFLKQIIEVLELNKDVKWLIVGIEELHLIKEKFSKYVENKQIIFVAYEKSLFELLKISNVCVNPIRQGGGESVSMAMQACLPVVSVDLQSDVGGLIGVENCIKPQQFKSELLKLYSDKNYYNKMSKLMEDRIKEFLSFDRTCSDLINIFRVAQESFRSRKGMK
ncbi:glycosyltransferase [Bacillaceae bacterium CLA-AA-H227]|uniref:Glycosyltransferase n=1 Tax=Robertmurraya yapensis (ex Hitch et al 2024) TaxID=3133160 RepID=A0ACC6SBX0_9BACI